MTNLPIENNFILTVNNDSHLKLPSTVVFDRFLIRNDDQYVAYNRNLELPVHTETDCDKITLVAKNPRVE